MYKSLIEESYTSSGLEHNIIQEISSELNCFIKSPPLQYPPRLEFEQYTHNLKKNNQFILKYGVNGRVTVAIRDEEFRIIDIFLDVDFQGNGTAKKMLKEIRAKIFSDYPTVRYVTLSSLSSGVVAWHKMGFEFYVQAHKIAVRNTISETIGRVDSIKKFSKEELEVNDCYRVLENANLGHVPMYMEVKR